MVKISKNWTIFQIPNYNSSCGTEQHKSVYSVFKASNADNDFMKGTYLVIQQVMDSSLWTLGRHSFILFLNISWVFILPGTYLRARLIHPSIPRAFHDT